MRWVNHKLVTGSLIYAITGGFVATFTAMATSHLPDMMEMRGIIPHRTITHWIYLWISLVVFCFWGLLYWKNWLLYIAFYAAIGGLCHLIEDFMSASGIPFGHPMRKTFGIGLYKTKGDGEEITAASLTIIFVISALIQGYFGSYHLQQEVASVNRLFVAFLSLGAGHFSP